MSNAAKVWIEPWDVNRRLSEIGKGLDQEVLRYAAERAQAAWAACTPHHPRCFLGIARWAEGNRGLRDKLAIHSWEIADNRGQPLVVSPDGKSAITVLSGDENTGKAGFGYAPPRTTTSKGAATVEAVQNNAGFLFSDMEQDARAKWQRLQERSKSTWVHLLHSDAQLGQLRMELSLPTLMDEDRRIVGWEERIILPPVEFEPIPELSANEGPDDGDISIEIKRRA